MLLGRTSRWTWRTLKGRGSEGGPYESTGEAKPSPLRAHCQRHNVRFVGDAPDAYVAGDDAALFEDQVQAVRARKLLAPSDPAPRLGETLSGDLHHRREVRKEHRAQERLRQALLQGFRSRRTSASGWRT